MIEVIFTFIYLPPLVWNIVDWQHQHFKSEDNTIYIFSFISLRSFINFSSSLMKSAITGRNLNCNFHSHAF